MEGSQCGCGISGLHDSLPASRTNSGRTPRRAATSSWAVRIASAAGRRPPPSSSSRTRRSAWPASPPNDRAGPRRGSPTVPPRAAGTRRTHAGGTGPSTQRPRAAGSYTRRRQLRQSSTTRGVRSRTGHPGLARDRSALRPEPDYDLGGL